MTLGAVGRGYPLENLAALMSAAEDRMLSNSLTSTFEAGPALLSNGMLDPSDGGNYNGGSSYSDELPLLPSNAGLAGTGLSRARSINAGAMSVADALRWSPSPLAEQYAAMQPPRMEFSGVQRMEFSGLEADATGPNWTAISLVGIGAFFLWRTYAAWTKPPRSYR